MQVPDRAVIRDQGNPIGEAVVWYVHHRGSIIISCFVPADAVSETSLRGARTKHPSHGKRIRIASLARNDEKPFQRGDDVKTLG